MSTLGTKQKRLFWFYALATLVIGGYICKLAVTGKLPLYIHPRYQLFAAVMSIIAIVIVCLAMFGLASTKHAMSIDIPHPGIAGICLLALLVAAVAMPPRSLSSDTLKKRQVITPTYGSIEQSDGGCPDSIGDSVTQLVGQISHSPARCFEGKTIHLSGYIMTSKDQSLPDGYVYITRTLVSCCIVDARPYGIPVKSEQGLLTDQWVNIEGRLAKQTVRDRKVFVLVPEKINKVADPKRPYDYYKNSAPEVKPTLTPL